jgi:serine/threonine protein kinase/tetratricopeptide (TPR) repeat protein
MATERLERIESLFHQARLLEPGGRAAYLDEACGDDLDLRAEVESLLSHADHGTAAVDLRAALDSQEVRLVQRGPLAEGPGMRIGHYKILEEIGSGGFGVVYMAEQERPVRRKVALKIIKLGMDTKQVIARFEAERQALALMDHPNIARVLDAGATETGRPYFVMELVRGIPLTEFCDSRQLSPLERLELFVDVCHGVQHAHQKGVIHRDLKPSNVLVTLHDDKPVPKIIDFGIAKATAHRLTERTLFTEFRQFIGTPEYMSPDQAEISGPDIDTRSDVYSLGVILYELLTGTTPFDPQTLRTCGHAEMQRIIKEVEPPMPSTRVGALEREGGRADTARSVASGNGQGERAVAAGGPPSEEATIKLDRPPRDVPASEAGRSSGAIDDIAHQRRVEPSGLRRLLRGDLDWIIMKAMEKDRSRRYQTAGEMASDVERYLSDRPVIAGPPSTRYRMRKFIRRHRLGVTAAMLIAAAMIIGTTLAITGQVQATRQARRLREANGFLQSLIIDVGGEDGAEGPTNDEIIERGRRLYEDDHAVIGTLLTTRASSLAGAGRIDDAIDAQREALAQFRRAHRADHPSIATALVTLSERLEERRDLAEAESTYREAIAMRRRLHGDAHRLTGDALEGLTSLLVETGDQARNEEIKDLWTDTVEAYEASLGPLQPTTVRQVCTRATWLANHGFVEEAPPALEEAARRGRQVLDRDDITLFLTLNAYGQHLLIRERNYEEGVAVVHELIEIADLMWGPSHYVTLAIRAQLAAFTRMSGDIEGAGEALRDYVAQRRAAGPSPNLSVLMSAQQAMITMRDWMDEHDDVGRDFWIFLVEDARGVVDPDRTDMASLLWDAAMWLDDHGYAEDAEPFLAERLAWVRAHAGEIEDEPVQTLIHLGELRVRMERAAEGEPLLRECLEIRQASDPEGSWTIASARSGVGFALCGQGRYEEAEPFLVDGYAGVRDASDAPADRRRELRRRVVELYERWGRPTEAARWRDDQGPPSP